ncbi:hypothetical protein LguiB_009822 [Lonicera macranthoides]
MEEKLNTQPKVHCLVVPYLIQGHINPLLQFSRRLQHKRLKVTLALTRSMFNTTQKLSGGPIGVDTISDGYDDGGRAQAEDPKAYLTRFQRVGSETLALLVDKLCEQCYPVDCIIYNAFMPWVLDVAKKFKLINDVFFIQSAAVNSIYNNVHCGMLKVPLTGDQVLIAGLPPLQPSDMPSFIYDIESFPVVFDLVVNQQLSNVGKVDWVLCNTFLELEDEVVEWMRKLWPLRTIGPAIPSLYLDGRLQDDKGYGLNIFKPNIDSCIKWLSERRAGSVVYVSFGSLAKLGSNQMEELAWGLRRSSKYFLWVVRVSEEAKLPDKFVEETSEKGLVVSWCPQLDVLSHKATGSFVTHCGWNSILEALSLGVPMVAMPQWSDQFTNAKYVANIWKIGIKTRSDDDGITCSAYAIGSNAAAC